MVDLYVGPEKEHFHVHKAAICGKIPYFEKMFKEGGFAESYNNSVTFPEDDPVSFDMLLGWVYRGSFMVPKEGTDAKGRPILTWSPGSPYQLAEKLCLPALQDHAMDTILEYDVQINALPNTTRILDGYSRTRKNSGLRKYLALCCAFVIVQGTACSCWTVHDLSDAMAKDIDLNRDVLTILRSSGGKVQALPKHPNAIFTLIPQVNLATRISRRTIRTKTRRYLVLE